MGGVADNGTMRGLRCAFLLMLLLGIPGESLRGAPRAAALEAGPPPTRDAPAFETTPCPHLTEDVAREELVECGVLTVPERRDGRSERVVRVAVSVLRQRGLDPAPDPILLLPGPAWHGHLAATEAWLDSGLRQRRDLILVDPRGTGFSEPSLDCPDIRQLQDELRAVELPPEEIARRFTAAGASCRDRLIAAGADLSAYDHAAAAADLEDLRRALGIAEWNVYGIGHGTRLALTLLRDHPEAVRSAVLDSVVPPQVDEFRLADRIAVSMATISAGCAAEPACREAFVDLEGDVARLVENLNAEPIVVEIPHPITGAPTKQLLNGDLVGAGFLQAQAVTDLIPVLPLTARELLRRNEEIVAVLAGGIVAGPGEIGPFNQGAAYSVRCRDEAAFADPEQALRDSEALPWLSGLFRRASEQAVCADWPIGEPDPLEREPVHSNVPALLLAGEYDSLTPPAWSRAAAASLSRSTLVEFQRVGHAPSRHLPCAIEIRDAFIAEPGRTPDLGCVAAIQFPPFVTDVHLNGGVLRAVRGLVAEPDPLQIGVVVGSGLVFVGALVAWPITAARRLRRIRRRPAGATGTAEAAHGLAPWLPVGPALLASAINLAFIGGFAWFVWDALRTVPAIMLFGLPGAAGPLFGLAWLSVLAAPFVVVGAAVGWARRIDTPVGRWQLAAVPLASVCFAGYLVLTGLARL